MSYLIQVALVLWDLALPLTDLSKLVNVTPSVITFGSARNHVRASFHLPMENSLLVKERHVIHFRNDHAQNGWITTCVDILDKVKVPILLSVEQMRNLRMNIEHFPVAEFLTCPLFGMQRTALSVSASNHPVLDIMALATSGWKPMHSFASEETTCPACAGKHRPHTYKEGCKKKPITKKEEPKPAKTTTAKAVLKNILSPDTKLEVPEKSFEDQPMKSSGQSSGSKDGIPARPEPQPDEEHEVKTESKEPIKTEPGR